MNRGADLLIQTLAEAGVKYLFSLSGNHILSIYDAAIGSDLEIIHTRHEAATVHMADAWGRLTEQPGVALVTGGPGHANALSALYVALMAESPLVLLSGHAPLNLLGQGAFQEVDQVGMAQPVVKAAWLVEDPNRLGEDLARAFAIATAGRPGPVHLSLPTDVLEAEVTGVIDHPLRDAESVDAGLSAEQSSQILRHLSEAQRPLVLAGPAMARPQRWAEVARLSEATGIPALPMQSPRGVNDPWIHLAARKLSEADVVLLLGRKLDFSLKFGGAPFNPACRFIQIEAEAAQLRPHKTSLSFQTDPLLATQQLITAAKSQSWADTAWQTEVMTARETVPAEWATLRQSSRQPLHPLRVCEALQPYFDRGAILVSDGGEFGQWVQAGIEAETRLINGPSGSIGSSLPLALGAKAAHPDRVVFALMGDGTFGFHAMELDTALRYGLPVIVIVGNDARWNAEHQLQVRHYGPERTIGCDLLPTRYDELAQALGGHGELVQDAADLAPTIERAVASGLPACLNISINGVGAPVL